MHGQMEKFVEGEYKRYSKAKKKRGLWNGHQIRNAAQMAAGLADHFQEDECTGQFAHYHDPGYSDVEPFATPQKPKVRSRVPGSVEARRKGVSRVAGIPIGAVLQLHHMPTE